jgi:tetratricopeptide (TPR) repeat protein
MGEHEKCQTYYDSARALLEERIREEPNKAGYHSALGRAYAGLGMKSKAIQAGEKAVELQPIEASDFIYAQFRLLDLVRIYIAIGENEQAVNQLDFLLSKPGPMTVWQLRLDPRYDSLRENSQFRKLVIIR